MSLILITGVSTSGKSTIAQELVKRGYESYDTEHNGISAWYNRELVSELRSSERFLSAARNGYAIMSGLCHSIGSPRWRKKQRINQYFFAGVQLMSLKLEKYSIHMEKFAATGCVIIDDTGPLEQTVNHIQQMVNGPW
jgi:nucleoside-triphosphatase THEP1